MQHEQHVSSHAIHHSGQRLTQPEATASVWAARKPMKLKSANKPREPPTGLDHHNVGALLLIKDRLAQRLQAGHESADCISARQWRLSAVRRAGAMYHRSRHGSVWPWQV